MINEFPLLGDSSHKVIRRDSSGWAIYYHGNFLRYLNEFEAGFIDSALAARQDTPVGWRRPWEGDVSDEGVFIYTEDKEETEDGKDWTALFTEPPSKAQFKEAMLTLSEMLESFNTEAHGGEFP